VRVVSVGQNVLAAASNLVLQRPAVLDTHEDRADKLARDADLLDAYLLVQVEASRSAVD